MRVNIQKVTEVTVGEIKKGIVVLLGIENEDNIEDIKWITHPMNKIFLDINGDIIVVSQFTLYASTKKGNRPNFIFSGEPKFAEKMYHQFIDDLESVTRKNIKTGKFEADVKTSLINDGPVTININSKRKE